MPTYRVALLSDSKPEVNVTLHEGKQPEYASGNGMAPCEFGHWYVSGNGSETFAMVIAPDVHFACQIGRNLAQVRLNSFR